MSVTLHLLQASGRLSPYKESIQRAFDQGVTNVQRKLALPNVDVVVADNPDDAIPEVGIGGFAPTAHVLYISINPTMFEGLHDALEMGIQSTLAHELHHCARWQTIGYGKTLLQAIVSEGLADHFDIEINGSQPKPWSVALQGEALQTLEIKAKPFFNDETYSHSDWFFGSKEKDIPRWTGYSLGFAIVGKYIQESGKTASQLVAEDASAFVDMK